MRLCPSRVLLLRRTVLASNDWKYESDLNFFFFLFLYTQVVDGDHRSSCRRADVVLEDVSCVCETRKRPIDVRRSTVMERDIVS